MGEESAEVGCGESDFRQGGEWGEWEKEVKKKDEEAGA
jgi:hypothetical protein